MDIYIWILYIYYWLNPISRNRIELSTDGEWANASLVIFQTDSGEKFDFIGERTALPLQLIFFSVSLAMVFDACLFRPEALLSTTMDKMRENARLASCWWVWRFFLFLFLNCAIRYLGNKSVAADFLKLCWPTCCVMKKLTWPYGNILNVYFLYNKLQQFSAILLL